MQVRRVMYFGASAVPPPVFHGETKSFACNSYVIPMNTCINSHSSPMQPTAQQVPQTCPTWPTICCLWTRTPSMWLWTYPVGPKTLQCDPQPSHVRKSICDLVPPMWPTTIPSDSIPPTWPTTIARDPQVSHVNKPLPCNQQASCDPVPPLLATTVPCDPVPPVRPTSIPCDQVSLMWPTTLQCDPSPFHSSQSLWYWCAYHTLCDPQIVSLLQTETGQKAVCVLPKWGQHTPFARPVAVITHSPPPLIPKTCGTT